MPFVTFNPPVRQSPGTKDAPEIKVLSAEFGDGYTQEAPDGSNNVRSVVSLKWEVLLEDQATAIYDFLRARAKDAKPFYYDLTGQQMRKWTCKTFDRTWDTPNSVTATLRENFSNSA